MSHPQTLPTGPSLLAHFCRWECERADQVFLVQPDDRGVRSITWAQAGNEVRRMAAWLLAQGWPPGSSVALWGKNSAHWVLADLAIMMAGHVSVPLYATFNAQTLRYTLEHCGARACFVGKLDDTAAMAAGVPEGLPLVALPLAPFLDAPSWDSLIADVAPLAAYREPDPQQLWTIVYTSGTTGQPKGVMLTFGAWTWAVQVAVDRFKVRPSERVLSYLPLAHCMERVVVEGTALRVGGQVFFAHSLDSFIDDIQRAQPTIFLSVPRLWAKFQQGVWARLPEQKLQRLLKIPVLAWLVRRKILQGLGLQNCHLGCSGSAPLPAEVLNWYRQLGLNMTEGYGMTENCASCHTTMPGEPQPGTVGLPYPGVQARIDAQTGEIQMRSPGLMTGYYKESELSAAALTPDGWLRTGDKGVIDAQGCLRITGRIKDIFKTSKGKYLAPAPLEDLLGNHPAVEACVVTGAGLAQPLALLLLSLEAMQAAADGGRAALEESLRQHLEQVNAGLEAHEKLACAVVLRARWTPENGLVTPTFKVRRMRIEEHYAAHYPQWVALGQAVVWEAAADAAMS